MKYVLVAFCVLAASPALAQTYTAGPGLTVPSPSPHTIALTAEENQTLRSLIDSTIKQVGLGAARVLVLIADKLDAAAQKAQAADKEAAEAAKIKAAVDAAKAPPK